VVGEPTLEDVFISLARWYFLPRWKDQVEKPGLFDRGTSRFPILGPHKRDLLSRLCLLRDNQRHDQIDDCDSAEAREKRQHGQQADDGWVNVEIFAQPSAYTRDHSVGCTASQWLVIGVHDIALLSIISM
jgi:hypothetical protein